MFKGQLFQLKNRFCDDEGLIYTPDNKIAASKIENLWQKFCKEHDVDVDAFVEHLNSLNSLEENNPIYFERVFVEEILED